ncbi:MAG: hypothetical protein ACE5H5_01040 [Nitrospinota bacterium]
MLEPAALMRLRRRYLHAHFLLHHVVSNRFRRTIRSSLLKPFCVTYHVTDRPHIGHAAFGQPALRASPEAPLADVLTLLKKVRKEVRMLYLTGGEPLLHPAIRPIARAAREMGFEPLVLETNFTLIDEHEELLQHCHLVVVPLETVEVGRQAARWQCDPGWVERLLRNLVLYGPRQEELGVTLIVKCVIGEGTIEGVYDLMEFCFEHNLLFAPTTAANLGLPDRRLQNEPAYERLRDYVIARKKAGAPILGGPESLRLLLAFEDFACYPTLAPHLAPNGDVFYPCLSQREAGGNLLGERTLAALNRRVNPLLRTRHEERHDCRLHSYVPKTWMFEHFLDRSLEGLPPLVK